MEGRSVPACPTSFLNPQTMISILIKWLTPFRWTFEKKRKNKNKKKASRVHTKINGGYKLSIVARAFTSVPSTNSLYLPL